MQDHYDSDGMEKLDDGKFAKPLSALKEHCAS